jgi:hypothetical protein
LFGAQQRVDQSRCLGISGNRGFPARRGISVGKKARESIGGEQRTGWRRKREETKEEKTYNRCQQKMKRQKSHRINLDMTPQLMHLQPALVVDVNEALLRDGGEGFVVEETDVSDGFVQV